MQVLFCFIFICRYNIFRGPSYNEIMREVGMGCGKEILQIFSKNIRLILGQVSVDFGQVQEIRLRVQGPLLMICQNQEFYVTSEGTLSTHGILCMPLKRR